MAINNAATALAQQLEQEIRQYLTEVVDDGNGHTFSTYKITRRISLFENHIYPTGKFDSQGNYKYWFDIQGPRIDAEVKNVDFDTKDPFVYSDRKNDDLACIVCNLRLREYLKETGQAEEINSAIEEGSGWGNVVWKRIKKTYERVDLRNFFVINQTARTLDDTPVIERHQLGASALRVKEGVWENIDEVLEQCKSNTYKTEVGSLQQETTVPYYELYERHGEVCLADLKAWQGKKVTPSDRDTYVFARVIGAGTKSNGTGADIKYIVFAEELAGKKNSDIFKEYHRGRYKGRWWREGLYELLFDLQVRANQIGNQLAQGLELASKHVYSSEDKLIVQNVMSDLKNGDIIKAKGLQHIEVRMPGADQLMADWNRIIGLANDIANSHEIIQGESTPNQPFRLGALLDTNANKLFDFLREKFSIPFTEIFDQWIVPELVADLRIKDVIRLTGDVDMVMRFNVMIVEDWYRRNLLSLPPHDDEQAVQLKQGKLQEIMSRPESRVTGLKELLKDFKPNARVVISGENNRLDAELQTYGSFAQLEGDPVRRSAIIDLMMKKKGIDVGSLPRSAPAAPTPVAQ